MMFVPPQSFTSVQVFPISSSISSGLSSPSQRLQPSFVEHAVPESQPDVAAVTVSVELAKAQVKLAFAVLLMKGIDSPAHASQSGLPLVKSLRQIVVPPPPVSVTVSR
jgi:hypothetical protein